MTITFPATIAPTTTALKIDGEPDTGGRLTLDIPGSALPQILELAAYARGVTLRVTVEVERA